MSHPIYLEHKNDNDHPKSPERISVVNLALNSLKLTPIEARKATWSEICVCHTDEYVQSVEHDIKTNKTAT